MCVCRYMFLYTQSIHIHKGQKIMSFTNLTELNSELNVCMHACTYVCGLDSLQHALVAFFQLSTSTNTSLVFMVIITCNTH